MEEVGERIFRSLPDLLVLGAALVGQGVMAGWILRRGARRWKGRWSGRARAIVLGLAAISMASAVLGFLLGFARVARHFPAWAPVWGRAGAVDWMLLSVAWIAGYGLVEGARALAAKLKSALAAHARVAPGGVGAAADASRRDFLKAAQLAVFAAPVVAGGYGTFVQRHQLALREQKIEIPNLPQDLDGLRIAQLTDIHLSPFLSRAELARAVDMANESKPHLTVVTGDLVTNWRDPLDDCLAELSRLRSDAGVFACMGNHEEYAGAVEHADREGARQGIRFLRKAAVALRFGRGKLNLAGVDYQRRHRYLVGAEELVDPAAFNVLLSHNPDVFAVAAGKGFPLTISGHTHGGQVKIEILSTDLSAARFFTPYTDGLYQRGNAAVFVSRGIGTIGIPARLGAPPEVAVLHLCRT
jgi:predicted MPP superfamily phosphohydrolase